MNRDDVIRMAREAGFELTMWQLSFGYEACGTHETFERFASLVAAAERERCIDILKTTYIIDDGEDYAQLVLDRINEDS